MAIYAVKISSKREFQKQHRILKLPPLQVFIVLTYGPQNAVTCGGDVAEIDAKGLRDRLQVRVVADDDRQLTLQLACAEVFPTVAATIQNRRARMTANLLWT